jgi:hypothetical protein
MPKTIRVVVHAELELPDKAEVIRFRDEVGEESDYVKFMGRLFRPDIEWLQYFTSHITKKMYGGKATGVSWESVDDDTFNKYFAGAIEKWYLEER